MPLTRVDGDFSQISNIIRITIPDVPPPAGKLVFLGWQYGITYVLNEPLTVATRKADVDPSAGYFNGYEINEDGSIFGAYGAFGEGSSTGASRSEDQSDSWLSDGFPIYNNAPPRDSRVAFGNDIFVHVGTRNTGVTAGATSTVFGNDAFTWDGITASLQVGIDNSGAAGVDFHNGFFYAYGNNGWIGRVDIPDNDWVNVASDAPSHAFQQTNSLPYARFAGLLDTVVAMFCGRISISFDNGLTWNTTDFTDVFTDTDMIGGAASINTTMFGLAAGDGAFVALGNGASSTTDGVLVFTADQIQGAGGSFPTGILQFACQDFIGNPTNGQVSGTRISGSLMGYSNISVATFGGSGIEMSIAIQVPTADAPASPRTAFFIDIDIPGISPGPILQTASFAFASQVVGSNTQYIWRFGFVGLSAMNEDTEYTATFTPAGPITTFAPRIRRTTDPLSLTWEDISVPVTSPPIDVLLDLVYDSDGQRFIGLGRSVVSGTPATGGTLIFDAVDITGIAGSVPTGFLTYHSINPDITTGGGAGPEGSLVSGSLAGYTDFGIVRTGELGGQTAVFLRVPTAELRADPQNDYFSTLNIPAGGISSVNAADAVFSINDGVGSTTELLWYWIDGDALSGETQANLGQVALDPVITNTVFHILKSTDAGATFTSTLSQTYPNDGALDLEKGWLRLYTPITQTNLGWMRKNFPIKTFKVAHA